MRAGCFHAGAPDFGCRPIARYSPRAIVLGFIESASPIETARPSRRSMAAR